MSYHVVVARYNEDLSWLNKYNLNNVIIYNKGSFSTIDIPVKNIVNLPNVGRETHTYLTYIIDNYHNLPDVIHFTQGSIDDHHQQNNDFLNITEYSHNYTTCSFMMGFNVYPPRLSYYYTPLDPAECDGVEWFRRYVNPYVDMNCMNIWCGAIFSVRREYILSRPKQYYQTLLQQVQTFNPEVGHFFERSWFYIFNCNNRFFRQQSFSRMERDCQESDAKNMSNFGGNSGEDMIIDN